MLTTNTEESEPTNVNESSTGNLMNAVDERSSSNSESIRIDNGEDDERTPDAKRFSGSRFCGCCCDFRKAVISVNAIVLVEQLIEMTLVGFLGEESGPLFEIGEAAVLVYIVFTMLGIFGALRFHRCAVITASLFYSILIIMKSIRFSKSHSLGSIAYVVVSALFLYPHIGFLILMDRGIMTEENYDRVATKCCC